MRRNLLTALFLAPLLTVALLRFVIPGSVMRSDISANALHMLEIIQREYQPGDIVYHVGDGSYTEMMPYTTILDTFWRMPYCAPVRGGLSPKTQGAMGMHKAPLEQIRWSRAWVITAVSPMTPQCEQTIIRRWLIGLRPTYCMVNNPIEESCVYLVNRATP